MVRLTETVKCGGCAAKAAASDLARVLAGLPVQQHDRVLIGLETSDDAGVYLLPDGQALIQTLDFFPPIVDDPYEFGQIAAANSLSDVYAMGGVPVTAMNIVCFPMDGGEHNIPRDALLQMLLGGAAKVRESGAALLGGHTVNDEVIKFGLSVTGTAAAETITANQGARPGDLLVLTKALGTGMVTTALKRGEASAEEVAAAVRSMQTLNAAASRAMVRTGVNAATDVTGFGLLGHLCEMLAAPGLGARLSASALPVLPGAREHAARGLNTGGGRANAAHVAARTHFDDGVADDLRALCCDPQTSGGLLMAVDPGRLEALLAALEDEGVPVRAVIGEFGADDERRIRVAP